MPVKEDEKVHAHRSEGGGEGLALTLVEDRYVLVTFSWTKHICWNLAGIFVNKDFVIKRQFRLQGWTHCQGIRSDERGVRIQV